MATVKIMIKIGVMNYNNDDIYEGEWLDDKRNGRGKISYNK